jgi:hypothetical protein
MGPLVSTPFDPNRWPSGFGPDAGRGGVGGGGEEPPHYDDADAPAPDDGDTPPADPATGEIVGDAPGGPAAAPTKSNKPGNPKEDPRAAFLQWVALHLSRVEAHGVPVRQKPAWCPEWWKHPEVVQRFYVSWKAYVKASKLQAEGDGLAKSGWWVQHWDHHARIIFDKEHGPFRACNQAGHLADNKGDPLVIIPDMPPADFKLM